MPTKDNESQRKLFGAALAAKRGNKPISKKVADIAASTSEKELSKMASKNEGADVGQEFDNQVGEYYAVQRPYDGCEPNKLVHKVNPLQGVQGIGVEPVQIYGAYIEEKMAMTMAEKLCNEFVDAGIRLYDVSFYQFSYQIFKDFEFEREKSNFKVRSKKERR